MAPAKNLVGTNVVYSLRVNKFVSTWVMIVSFTAMDKEGHIMYDWLRVVVDHVGYTQSCVVMCLFL